MLKENIDGLKHDNLMPIFTKLAAKLVDIPTLVKKDALAQVEELKVLPEVIKMFQLNIQKLFQT